MNGQVGCHLLEMVSRTSLSQLPYVSTTNGMQDQPNCWHLGPLEWSLQTSVAWATRHRGDIGRHRGEYKMAGLRVM